MESDRQNLFLKEALIGVINICQLKRKKCQGSINKTGFDIKVIYSIKRTILLWHKHKAHFTTDSSQELLFSWWHEFTGSKANVVNHKGTGR